MDPEVEPAERGRDMPWFVISRRQEYEGESRANLLRLIGIAGFYSIELINYYGLQLGFLEMPRQEGVDRDFHVAVTALAVAWTALAMGVQFCLRSKVFPDLLKYASTGGDIALLTSVLILADGPGSPLVVVYFLMIPLAALRFSLPLVRFATVATMADYIFINGYARWFTERDLVVPRYYQLIVLLSLLLTGVLLGQVLRRVRAMARAYSDAPRPTPSTPAPPERER